MDIVKTIEKYRKAAKAYAAKSKVKNSHIIEIISSVMMTRDGVGYPGGGFVTAVVNNDLAGAVGRADSECLKHLDIIVSAKQYANVK